MSNSMLWQGLQFTFLVLFAFDGSLEFQFLIQSFQLFHYLSISCWFTGRSIFQIFLILTVIVTMVFTWYIARNLRIMGVSWTDSNKNIVTKLVISENLQMLCDYDATDHNEHHLQVNCLFILLISFACVLVSITEQVGEHMPRFCKRSLSYIVFYLNVHNKWYTSMLYSRMMILEHFYYRPTTW